MTNLDLVNWTMREARQLGPEHHAHGEIEGSSSLNDILLGVLEGERGEPNSEGSRSTKVGSVQLTVDSPTATPPVDVLENAKPDHCRSAGLRTGYAVGFCRRYGRRDDRGRPDVAPPEGDC